MCFSNPKKYLKTKRWEDVYVSGDKKCQFFGKIYVYTKRVTPK